MYLIFDTETTGLPRNWNAPITDVNNWPRCIQIAWQLHDEWGVLLEHKDYLIKPEGFNIPYDAEKIHGISTDLAFEKGILLADAMAEFQIALSKTKFLVGQNVKFDINILGCEFHRLQQTTNFLELPVLDTCTETTAGLCQLPGGRGGKYKLPTLTELHEYLFGQKFNEAHNASADVEATTRCFFELLRRGIFSQKELQAPEGYLSEFGKKNPDTISVYGLQHVNLKQESDKLKSKVTAPSEVSSIQEDENLSLLEDIPFAHLHNHTQYSILQSTSEISSLLSKAVQYNLSAVAMTDIGNMMAAFNFVKAFGNHNKEVLKKQKEAEEKGEEFTQKTIKPILGAELYVCQNHKEKTKQELFMIPFLAKNKKGYHRLARLCSQGFIDGFYYFPRVDKQLILELKEDLIVTTGGLKGEVPWLLLNVGEVQAEQALLWWKEHFGEDFYIEINRHGTEEEERVNAVLLEWAKKHNIKYFAANENYYVEQKDSTAHDILLCVKDGEKLNTPIGRGRGFRYGLANKEYYFKSPYEMKLLFKDLPEAIECTNEIADKVESYELYSSVLLPAFEIPEEFKNIEDEKDGGKRGENAYLRHLTYEGAKIRYPELSTEIRERLDFELQVIEKTGYPGYFLIVQDFIAEARKMGVSVGPGRGSAAGSAVAYCTGITNIDPIAYNLLFERFLNPDRVSMPDIDIDFDDEGRGRVIQYVIDKYGSSQVAQIITYGTMAAKSSIRDTGRVLDLPLSDTDRIAKLVPDMMKLGKLLSLPDQELQKKLNPEEMEMTRELKAIMGQENLEGQTVRQAKVLEGSVRNTGTHACGVIITPTDIRQFVPVALVKDSEMWCTQFDNAVVESAGLLKMDFLGLKTLTLIKDAIKIIKDRQGIELDPDKFPLDDELTYQLFQKGETVGIFQYESPGMQKHLKDLKPTVFADLIAMNALYRPGPLEYIPSFIKRKHGDEPITYDLEGMDEYLSETYGITVYQEQVMLLSQKLAGFTKGDADVLRKAMGKKQKDVLDKMRPKFIENGKANGHEEKTLEKVWNDWEAFASYAFNKSHSTCYAYVAYQTAYLKAHYPAEYMASVLSNNMNDIKQVTFFMEECRRMGVPVLGPDVNESVHKFTVNQKGEVRFGMGAIKGVGEGAVESIVEERQKNGPYSDIFELTKRINLRQANKKTLEGLAYAGAFDSFKGYHRAQYFFKANERDVTYLEKAIRYGSQFQSESGTTQQSLFGGESTVDLPKPIGPKCDPWSGVYALKFEKDVIGIFISGHPLDDYKLEIDAFCNADLAQYNTQANQLVGKDLTLAGIVTEAAERLSKKGNMFGVLTIADYTDSATFYLFGDTYLKYRHFLVEGALIYLKGKLEPRRFDKNLLDFSISNIDMLGNFKEKLVKSVHINLDVRAIDQLLVDEIFELVEKNPGKCELLFTVTDPEDKKFTVDLASNKYKVNPSAEFLKSLQKNSAMEVKLI